MSRVTGKRQVTIPKTIADRYGIEPGDEIDWLPAGDGIRVVVPGEVRRDLGVEERLDLFDRATERQRARQAGRPMKPRAAERGWRREDLYERGRPR